MPIQAFIYGVFAADGCECKFLKGVFSSQEKADAFAVALRLDRYAYGDPELVSVEMLILDSAALPDLPPISEDPCRSNPSPPCA